MANDQPAYTGATYASEFTKLPNETLSEYMMRLAKLRAQGILGGGGMLDVKQPVPVEEKSIAYTPKLGQVVINAGSGSGDSNNNTAERVVLTPEERMRNDIAVQSGIVGDPMVIGQHIPVIGTPLKMLTDWQRESNIEDTLRERAISQEEIDKAINNPDYAKELARTYNMGGLGTDIPSNPLNVDEAGSSLLYQFDNIGDTLLKSIGLRDKTEDPFLTKVAGASSAMPQLPTVVGGLMTPQATAPVMTPTGMLDQLTQELTNKTVTTHTDTGTGTEYTVQSGGGWSAADTSSWDTSGGGTNADGSYDISSWF